MEAPCQSIRVRLIPELIDEITVTARLDPRRGRGAITGQPGQELPRCSCWCLASAGEAEALPQTGYTPMSPRASRMPTRTNPLHRYQVSDDDPGRVLRRRGITGFHPPFRSRPD
jgi:hypothetical protein